MDCREVKNLITLYVDGQLDPSESREMVEHISRCESCYFATRAERFTKKLIKNSIIQREPPLELLTKIQTIYFEKKSIFPLILRFVPAIILLLVLGLALYYKISEQRFDNKIFRNITNPPMTASINDINKFFNIFKNSSDKIFINQNNTSNIRFIGLRYNKFEDRDAAHIFYNYKGRNLSVFAISGNINDKIFSTPFQPFKRNSYIVKRDGKKLLLSSDKDITYAIAGEADENELYEILSSLK